MQDVRQWISDLGPELSVQAELLGRLLTAAEADTRWDWLELRCSIPDGRGDELSDLDVGLGHVGADPPAPHEVARMLRGLGDVVDLFEQPWEGGLLRWWALYADGSQIDLVVMPAQQSPGRRPRSVALLDRRGHLSQTFTPATWTASPEQPRRWLLAGWEALSNADKYIQRGSLLEAIDQIHRARTHALQLWATGERVVYPVYGLISLLDDAAASLPAGIEETYPTADREAALAAALATADLLHRAGNHANKQLDTPVRPYVLERLRQLNGNRSS